MRRHRQTHNAMGAYTIPGVKTRGPKRLEPARRTYHHPSTVPRLMQGLPPPTIHCRRSQSVPQLQRDIETASTSLTKVKGYNSSTQSRHPHEVVGAKQAAPQSRHHTHSPAEGRSSLPPRRSSRLSSATRSLSPGSSEDIFWRRRILALLVALARTTHWQAAGWWLPPQVIVGPEVELGIGDGGTTTKS
jgi:hypothetical protein